MALLRSHVKWRTAIQRRGVHVAVEANLGRFLRENASKRPWAEPPRQGFQGVQSVRHGRRLKETSPRSKRERHPTWRGRKPSAVRLSRAWCSERIFRSSLSWATPHDDHKDTLRGASLVCAATAVAPGMNLSKSLVDRCRHVRPPLLESSVHLGIGSSICRRLQPILGPSRQEEAPERRAPSCRLECWPESARCASYPHPGALETCAPRSWRPSKSQNMPKHAKTIEK